MTREEIETLPAGVEIDRRIAALLGMDASGLVQMPVPCPDGMPGCCVLHLAPHFPNGAPLPAFSSDLTAVWLVTEALQARGCTFYLADCEPRKWAVPERGWMVVVTTPDGHNTGDVFGPTAPLAICRAALLALRRPESPEGPPDV